MQNNTQGNALYCSRQRLITECVIIIAESITVMDGKNVYKRLNTQRKRCH